MLSVQANMKTKRKRKTPRKGRSKKRNLKHLKNEEPEDLKNAPHSFVFHRGVVGEHVSELIKNFRKVMEPFTASELKARRANKLKDFLSIAGVLHVSHMCIFTATGTGTHLKVARAPRGPTLYFRVIDYSLSKDVISKLKRQLVFQRQFINPPLIVMNNFSGEGVHFKLMSSMFQNMFPTINLTKVIVILHLNFLQFAQWISLTSWKAKIYVIYNNCFESGPLTYGFGLLKSVNTSVQHLYLSLTTCFLKLLPILNTAKYLYLFVQLSIFICP